MTTRAVRWGAVGALLLLVGACSDGTAEDEAEVLGIQVERDGETAVTSAPTTSSSPQAPTEAEAPTPSPSPSPAPSASPVPTATAVAPTTAPAPRQDPPASPTPPPPSPSPAPSPSPSPVGLTSREGHSYLTWFRDEEPDGQGGTRHVWGEVSAAPPITREGSEPLRVTLVDLSANDDPSGPRTARCTGWLEADGDRDVRARGTVVVDLLVDRTVVATVREHVDALAPAGGRIDLAAVGEQTVTLPDVEHVTCAIRFVTD